MLFPSLTELIVNLLIIIIQIIHNKSSSNSNYMLSPIITELDCIIEKNFFPSNDQHLFRWRLQDIFFEHVTFHVDIFIQVRVF